MNERLQQLITLGREHYHAGEYDQAEQFLAQVVRQATNFPDIYNMLGVIYHTQGKFDEAEASFESALSLNPNYTEAALNLSVTYNDRGKYQQARDVYARAVANSYSTPNTIDPFARGKLANMHADLGAVYGGIGLYDEAIREYTKALDLCPGFVDLRVRLGNVYRDMGRHESAISEFERAKSLKADYVPARIHLGVTLYSVGRVTEAIAEWEDVLRNDPNNKSAALYLRMVREDNAPAPGSAKP